MGCNQHNSGVDRVKNPSQQRDTLPIQVPIRLTNIWYGRLDGIMDLLASKVWLVLVGFKAQEHKMAQLSKNKLSYQTILTIN